MEQVLQILDVIGIDPAEFFAELFKWAGDEGSAKAAYVSDPVAELEMRRKLDHLQATLEGLVRVLVNKNLIAANESVAIFSGNLPAAPEAEPEVKRRRRKKAAAG